MSMVVGDEDTSWLLRSMADYVKEGMCKELHIRVDETEGGFYIVHLVCKVDTDTGYGTPRTEKEFDVGPFMTKDIGKLEYTTV